jgi:hypothetical protein
MDIAYSYQHDLLVYLNHQSLEELEPAVDRFQWIRPKRRRQAPSGAKDGRCGQMQRSLEALNAKRLNKQVNGKRGKRDQRAGVIGCNNSCGWWLNSQTAPASDWPDRICMCV